ncbi:MAG: glycosyltransferase [Patescibacteria group bacterium]|jgi:glycosyltransferase involved in cell wall biosynthesis
MNKVNFYVSAIYTSPDGSMGGNTKILLEIINELSDKYNFVILTTEPETFKKNIHDLTKVSIVQIPYPFTKFSFGSHIKECTYIWNFYQQYFSNNTINDRDYFYSCSDFGPDVVPVYLLKSKYKFRWIASLYLFIPNPIENIVRRYGFPPIKYLVYYLYQLVMIRLIFSRFDYCFITNDVDLKRFPIKKQKYVLPVYGGVNTELTSNTPETQTKIYDAVFCSRLHPQKGIIKLLTIWREVLDTVPQAKLAIIGNGEKAFESSLKSRATSLGLDKHISWLGYVNGKEKFHIYGASRLFIHPTVYDNNGMVAAEALCSGLPVVMFDLPALKNVYKEGCLKIEPYNLDKFSGAVVDLLTNDKRLGLLKPQKDTVAKLKNKWAWSTRAKLVDKFLQTLDSEKGKD